MQDAFSGFIDLDRTVPAPLYGQLYEQLRAAILSGRLPAGTHVPATRAMAAQLGVARNTVLAAVEQLAAEGYLDARRGAGTVVSRGLSGELTATTRHNAEMPPRAHRLSQTGVRLASVARDSGAGEIPRPFLPGIPDLGSFPADIWARLLRRASLRLKPDSAAYGAMSGLPRLRAVLAEHLREARGVAAEPEQIIVTSSAQAALDLLTRALIDPGDAVWIEEPGYLGARAAFAGAGARLVPVPVDGHGLNPAGRHLAPRVIYVTPSHQYPTGCLMPLARRLEVLDAAERHDAYVIEDDYDSEFQFQGRPVAALQGLDRSDRVLYVGTFSKILQPGLRAGYLVVPKALAGPLARMQRNTGQVVSAAVQLALADFIDEGHLRAHVRRMCVLYRERQDALAAAFGEHLPGHFSLEKPAGGMQLIAGLPGDADDVALSQELSGAGIVARPISRFYLGEPARRGFLFGFSSYSREAIDAAARTCARVMRGARL